MHKKRPSSLHSALNGPSHYISVRFMLQYSANIMSFSQNKPHQQDARFIQYNHRHGDHNLRKHVRRRRHDSGEDKGDDDENAPLRFQKGRRNQTHLRQEKQDEGQLEDDAEGQHEGNKKGQVRAE